MPLDEVKGGQVNFNYPKGKSPQTTSTRTIPKTSGYSSDAKEIKAAIFKQNNTLGGVAKGLRKAQKTSGMLIAGFGKSLGGLGMGATLAVGGPFGLLGGGIAYLGAYVIYQKHEKAREIGMTGFEMSALPPALIASIAVSPLSAAGKLIETMGKALLSSNKKELPESYNTFNDSFKTGMGFALSGKINGTAMFDILKYE